MGRVIDYLVNGRLGSQRETLKRVGTAAYQYLAAVYYVWTFPCVKMFSFPPMNKIRYGKGYLI